MEKRKAEHPERKEIRTTYRTQYSPTDGNRNQHKISLFGHNNVHGTHIGTIDKTEGKYKVK